MKNRPIRLLIVEDHQQVRKALCFLFESDSKFEIVGEAANGIEAFKKVADLRPDVVVMDVNMPELDGLDAAWLIKQLFPRVKVLLLSMHRSSAEELTSSGADGYLLKGGEFRRPAGLRPAAARLKFLVS